VILDSAIYQSVSRFYVKEMDNIAAAALVGDVRPGEHAWNLAKTQFVAGLDDTQRLIFNHTTADNLSSTATTMEQKDRCGSKTRGALRTSSP
jgi:hypothetical protein